MQLKKLKMLIKQGESDTLEFKQSTGRLHDGMKTICAFSNHDGGTLLFGVTNEGKIIGQEVSDKTHRTIANELERIEPHVNIKIEQVAVGSEKYVLVLTAKEGNNKPYTYDDRPYMRTQSTTQKMSRDEYEHLIHERQQPSNSWENLTTNKCNLNDLDKIRIKQVIHAAIAEGRLSEVATKAEIKEILKKLNLMIEERLTNAAVILFCKKEDKQFLQASLQMARFRGITKSEFIDNQMWCGNIFDLYEHAMRTLRFYLPVSAKIVDGNPFRVETPAIPYKVLREALVNALCHRDYTTNGNVTVGVYDDRVEVVSPGRLPPGIKLNELTKEHGSHPRNKLIAHVLYICRMIEKWGRGTLDMIESCKQSGNPIPQFEETTGSFRVIIPLKEPVLTLIQEPSLVTIKSSTKRTK